MEAIEASVCHRDANESVCVCATGQRADEAESLAKDRICRRTQDKEKVSTEREPRLKGRVEGRRNKGNY